MDLAFGEILQVKKCTSERKYIFSSYIPRWADFPEHIYLQETAYKLYADGRFYHFTSDLKEENALKQESLEGIQLKHLHLLQEALNEYLPEAKAFLER